MAQNNEDRDVACTMTDKEEKERTESTLAMLVPHYNGYEERENGVDIRFEGAGEALRNVAEFISNEKECCAFADYEITVVPPYDDTVLTITGPDGTKSMFRDAFAERLEAEAA